MWSGNKFIYSLFGLFIVVFVAEVDKLIFRAGWISIPGGAIVVYSGVTGAIVLGLMMTAGPKRIYLWSEMVVAIRGNCLFLFLYLSLVVLSFGFWLSDMSSDPLIFFDVTKSLLVCTCTIVLITLCYHIRRGWRIYVGTGFVVYCLSIWVDALWPGIFTELAGLGNFVAEGRVSGVSGLNLDSNSGSYIVAFLSVSLLDYRRFKVIDLVVLSFATLTILLTLSRSGLLIILLTVICYFGLIVTNSSGRRWFVSVLFAIAAVATAVCGWAAIRSIEHFETPKARIAVGQLLIQDEWFRTRLRASNEELIQTHLQGLKTFGQVNAPKAPELTVPGIAVTEPAIQAVFDPPALKVRSYMTYVDGGEYVHIESRRVARLRNAFDAIAESPLIGHGIGFNQNAGISAHNMFLAMWIDFGVLGLILYIALLIVGFWNFYRFKYWLGIFFMLVFSGVSIFVQHIFTLYTIFLILGLILSRRTEATSNIEPPRPYIKS